VPVIPILAPMPALSALIASGMDTDRFLYAGSSQLSRALGERSWKALAAKAAGLTLVLYEAPHRILETLADVEAVWGEQARVVVAVN